MAGSINRATIMGRVGKDPETRSLSSGDRLCNLSVATSENWRDKNSGEKKEKTEWHRVTVWGRAVDIVDKYVRKGDLIHIEGSIETRKWQQDGQDRYSTEIHVRPFGGSVTLIGATAARGGENAGTGRLRDREPGDDDGGRPASGRGSDLDDEIPF